MEQKKITGILGAMDGEIEGIVSAMEGASRRVYCGSEVFCGRIRGREVVLARSGIGKVNAAFMAQALIREFGADELYMTGVAGSLGGLRTLDALVPDGFVQYDVVKPGDPDGLIDILGEVVLRPDERMSSALAAAAGARRGILATGEKFVGSAADREDILRRFPSALAADMESGAVAQVCSRLGVPFACVRIVSDSGDADEYYDFVSRAAAAAVSAVLAAFLRGA